MQLFNGRNASIMKKAPPRFKSIPVKVIYVANVDGNQHTMNAEKIQTKSCI
jgi:hypothetical protein